MNLAVGIGCAPPKRNARVRVGGVGAVTLNVATVLQISPVFTFLCDMHIKVSMP